MCLNSRLIVQHVLSCDDVLEGLFSFKHQICLWLQQEMTIFPFPWKDCHSIWALLFFCRMTCRFSVSNYPVVHHQLCDDFALITVLILYLDFEHISCSYHWVLRSVLGNVVQCLWDLVIVDIWVKARLKLSAVLITSLSIVRCSVITVRRDDLAATAHNQVIGFSSQCVYSFTVFTFHTCLAMTVL